MRSGRGRGWEAQLDTQHDKYRKAGHAIVHKTHPPTMMARGKLVYKAKGAPDYLGRAGSRPVCFDAKEVAVERLPFANIKEHQAKDMEAWAKDRSAIVGIALRIKGIGTWWIDWRVLSDLWWTWRETKGAQASVDLEWLGRCASRMDGADWLGARINPRAAIDAIHKLLGDSEPVDVEAYMREIRGED